MEEAVIMSNADAAIAAVILGTSAAQELYGCSSLSCPLSLLLSSPFLLRLRHLLHLFSISHSPTLVSLGLPQDIATALTQSPQPDLKDLESTSSLETSSQPVKKPASPSSPDDSQTSQPSPAILEDPIVPITDEEKRRVIGLLSKGVKLQYIAGLFGIVNPKVIYSWNDWKKRPKGEMERNMAKRREIEERLRAGESVKRIKEEMKLKQKMYRELMGIPVGRIFTRAMYDTALQQMEVLGCLKVTSRKSGVPAYFIKKWLSGKGIPEKDLIDEDEEGTVEFKKKAIERFYETGNALVVSSELGLKTPQQLERWLAQFQRAVDEREKYDVRGKI